MGPYSHGCCHGDQTAFGSNIQPTKSQQVRFLASSGTNPDHSNKFTFRQTPSLQFRTTNNIPLLHLLLLYTSLLSGDSTNESSPFLSDLNSVHQAYTESSNTMRECYSPESRSMNKDSNSFRNSGAYTSPGTPDYGDNHGRGFGFQKGWCSERVPLPSNHSNLRRTSANILMPFNNGRTLPSKWDDAERWITSPVSGSGSSVFKTQPPPPPQRRPKSKSGPLGPTSGTTNYSPAFHQFLEGGSTMNVNGFAGSPFSTGVLVPNGYSFHEKIDENNVSSVVSRRDMATQMSPDSTSPPPLPSPVEDRRQHVRDVQVDKRVTMTKQPKRNTRRVEKNRSTEVNDLALTWNPTPGAMELSKVEKEEARIVAWENLQNAKAEASIRKLEMKLEKKKSASMEKIMNKLTVAQMKAQEMRKKMSASESPTRTTSRKLMSLHRYPKFSLTCCFFVH